MQLRQADASTGPNPNWGETVFRRIEHFYLVRTDPLPLMDFFATKLGLPVVWPYERYPGGFYTGAVFGGNLNIAFVNWVEAAPPDNGGLSLEPVETETAGDYRNLEAHRIPHVVMKPYVVSPSQVANLQLMPEAKEYLRNQPRALWTMTHLPDVLDEGATTYACKYHFDIRETKFRSMQSLLAQNSQEDSLGWLRVKTVRLHTREPEVRGQQWKRLLGPATNLPLSTDAWDANVEFVQGEAGGIQGIVVQVASLPRAAAYLRNKGIAFTSQPGFLRVTDSTLGDFELVLERN